MTSVLLLHGVGSDAGVWWRHARDLADLGHTVAALDLLGHGGRTDGPDRPWTVDDLAADVADRAEPCDLIVGHSLGALVAMAASAIRPDLTGAVLLEDPPGGAALAPVAAADGLATAITAARADRSGTVARTVADNPGWAVTDAERMVAARAGADPVRVPEFLRTQTWDLPALAKQCPVPVHLLLADGPESRLSEPARSQLRAVAAGTTLVRSGHSVYRDRPGMWLVTVLRLLAA